MKQEIMYGRVIRRRSIIGRGIRKGVRYVRTQKGCYHEPTVVECTTAANETYLPMDVVDTTTVSAEYIARKAFRGRTSKEQLIWLPSDPAKALTLCADYTRKVQFGGGSASYETLPAGTRLFVIDPGCAATASVWGILT